MPKFTFVASGEVTFTIEIVADNLDAAIDLARESATQSLCHQCCGGTEKDEWSTELDIDFPEKLHEVYVGDDHFAEGTPEFARAKEIFE